MGYLYVLCRKSYRKYCNNIIIYMPQNYERSAELRDKCVLLILSQKWILQETADRLRRDNNNLYPVNGFGHG